ncbi:G1/S-specific cyclin-D3-like [Uloborus diversus]|uniref:G1/S-specific cyclin-D3-like n=1 Tax=Uloborus diversus TaxID=327109 RepID=UPI002408FC9F|nr:G1/S-specific cyclin-D3-like [Uloborus diversus]
MGEGAAAPLFPNEWEGEVLNGLKWDVAGVVATDFLDPILHRLPDFEQYREMVHRHATMLIHITLLKIEVASMKPSILAVGAIGAAIRGLPRIEVKWPKVKELIPFISEMTDINPAMLEQGVEILERFVTTQIIRLETAKLQQAEDEATIEAPYDGKSLW